ncbi:hypothetical protein [Aestuariicoccus sp. MJ-SS9]|nr:hypothetical protein [Aestuariicoccus sp. MJ-SS9]MDU8911456.1 hypothetical protein [Aestuariicoccus sp. MJ-SS9]
MTTTWKMVMGALALTVLTACAQQEEEVIMEEPTYDKYGNVVE